MIIRRILWMLLIVAVFSACEQANPNFQEDAGNPEYFHQSMKQLSDVIVHDIFSPPVASRIFAYSSIAGYEAALPGSSGYRSLAGQLNGLEATPQPEEGKTYCFPLAGIHAFLKVGKAFTFSEDKMEAYQEELYAALDSIHIPGDVWDRSLAYGDQVADHILAWANEDMYKETRTYPKYSISDDPARWQPTPPDYMDGIEPHWKMIRTMVLDSAQQFTPPPPTAFSMDKNSKFMEETMEVYEALKVDDQAEREERTAIAKFWDCNPYVSHHTGHVMFATKKITPGGHWIGITKIACRKANADFMKTLEAYTITSIALFDAFISCWDEKYRSNLIRPETVINRYIDEKWAPTLQTPPFPEYTSGHSVISRAAAVALTSVFGDNFSFLDTTEEEYGLPAREFNSFMEASSEAAVSRLYGGIHYRPAIEYGVAQGEKVGDLVVKNVQFRQQLSTK
ncbi:MAG: vanadium-dependent haloperoxidase [Phaeodactylibacter sp.]|nr:vanadium-dependent haloperoxidase [Phaeodactylibacter sp.]MCB9266750.1 vanadium-dependent haloperoxidase [Lewinellaceae bacterium]MCB9286620.1 vanadium-dependent haloperoxidase [Lewinellaceae bacterium]